MENWRRRLALAIIGGVVIVLAYTLLYQWAMATFEDQSRTFTGSLQVVIESLTTAGFGGDTDHWTTREMNLLVIAMNLTGVLLVFLAIPLFAVPMFREAFYTRPPVSSSLTDHVIICGYSRRDEVLCNELEAAGIPYLYIDSDPDIVRRLIEDDKQAILGDSEHVETFHAANIEVARAVVADINDEINPTVILSAKRANPDIKILSVARRTEVVDYHRYAGASHVIEAPRVLGESLGLRAVTSFPEMFRAAVGDGQDLEVTELLVEEDSELIGQTLRETEILQKAGINVIGGWFGGKFLIPPDPDVTIVENTILLVAGTYELGEAKTRKLPSHRDDPSRVVICGYGVVGHAAANVVRDHGNTCHVIDIDPAVDPDHVGDVTEAKTFIDAEIEEARSVVLALNRDTTTIYATLVLNQLAPDIEIIARVHNPDNVWKLYNAGADFVLSMSIITGEMLAANLIGDQEILTTQAEFDFRKIGVGTLAGEQLNEADIRARTDCTVVAVERQGKIIAEVPADFTFEADDELVIAGSKDAIEQFRSTFPESDE